MQPLTIIDNDIYPHGQFINIGNSSNQSITDNLIFTCPFRSMLQWIKVSIQMQPFLYGPEMDNASIDNLQKLKEDGLYTSIQSIDKELDAIVEKLIKYQN